MEHSKTVKLFFKNLSLCLISIGIFLLTLYLFITTKNSLVLGGAILLICLGSLVYLIDQIFNQIKHSLIDLIRLDSALNSLNIGFLIFDDKLRIRSINTAAKRIVFSDEPESASSGILHQDQWTQQNSPIASQSEDLTANWGIIKQKLLPIFDAQENIRLCLAEKKTIKIDRLAYNNLYLKIFISPVIRYDRGIENIGVVFLIEDITEHELLEKSKDDFFSIASHELRTPLTTIRGNTSLIKDYYGDKITDPDLKQMVEDIHESSVRLIDLVNDFLDTSRLEQGRILFTLEQFNLADLTAQVIRDLVPLTKEKNLLLTNEISQELAGFVYADKNRVKQVLTNLLSNGIKFTDQGQVRLYCEQPDPNFLKILVQDSGRGILPHDQKLLFRKFQQASDNPLIRDSKRSTGLGLYISKLMIEGMGGEIKLESSEPGKGSVFSFTLPRNK